MWLKIFAFLVFFFIVSWMVSLKWMTYFIYLAFWCVRCFTLCHLVYYMAYSSVSLSVVMSGSVLRVLRNDVYKHEHTCWSSLSYLTFLSRYPSWWWLYCFDAVWQAADVIGFVTRFGRLFSAAGKTVVAPPGSRNGVALNIFFPLSHTHHVTSA